MTLDVRVRQDLISAYDRLTTNGQITPPTRLPALYAIFQQRFGPQVLASLDGEALLFMLKPSSTKDNLAYWLEFKDDEEFPAIFGGIAGGSALKWGIYWRNEAGSWMTGANIHPRQISLNEAVTFARRDRDQLLAGARLIEALPRQAPDEAYRRLQDNLAAVAPNVQDTAWGHKYFSLLFPDRISDIHVIWHQQLQLIKLLEVPPEPSGRYVCEGRYVAIAKEVNLPLHSTLTVIYQRNGSIRNYWRLDVAGNAQRWEMMRDGSCVALGWPEVGDMSTVLPSAGAKEEIKQRVLARYGPTDSASRIQQLVNLGKAMNEGDCVVEGIS